VFLISLRSRCHRQDKYPSIDRLSPSRLTRYCAGLARALGNLVSETFIAAGHSEAQGGRGRFSHMRLSAAPSMQNPTTPPVTNFRMVAEPNGPCLGVLQMLGCRSSEPTLQTSWLSSSRLLKQRRERAFGGPLLTHNSYHDTKPKQQVFAVQSRISPSTGEYDPR
jgi:hypothetical protein